MKKKIGIMGGTFNPIHLAHLQMASIAMEQKELDEVWFMPSKNPPHKDRQTILSEKIRSDMVRLAIKEEERFCFSDFELKRNGTTYTAETLELLRKEYPDVSWYFIMGADSFFSFSNWYHPEVIAKDAVILTVSRDGVDVLKMQEQARKLTRQYHGQFHILSMKQFAISSSEIRRKLKAGESVEAMLPDKVWQYIQKNHYYQ